MQKKTILFTIVALITAIQVIILPVAVLAEDVVSAEAPASALVVESAPAAVETPASVSESESVTAPVETSETIINQAETVSELVTEIPVIAPEQSDSVLDNETIGDGPTIDNGEIVADINLDETQEAASTALAAEPLALVEAAPAAPYELPNNPLCTGITGDLNGDGLINEYDQEVIKKMVKGLEPFDPCADLDGDGFIGSGDISILTATYKIFMPAYGIVLEPKNFNLPTTKSSVSADCTLGDANGDNKIDYKDEGLLLEMMKGEIPGVPAADLDGDGYISPADWSDLTFTIKITHAASADVTAAEKGNCNVPTALITYSLDGGETYANTAIVKNGDILTIKVVFSTPLNEYEYAFLDINNGMPTDIFMPKIDGFESIYNLTINRTDNLIATVSVRALNGVFTDNIVLTGGSTFTVRNPKPVVSGGSYGGSIAPACTEVTYSDWSDCIDGKQTRKMISKIPEACEWTEAQISALEQTCEEENVEAQIVTESNSEDTNEVLGVKVYPDGTLLRAINDFKIFIIENGFKRHVKTLQELAAKYRGQTIYNVAPEILAAYPTIE